MKFGFQCNRKVLILTGVYFAAALVMFLLTHYPPAYLFLCPLGYFVINGITLNVRPRWKWVTWMWTALYFGAGPVFSTLCIQHIILEPELYRKTKENILKLNMLCVLCIYLLLLAVIAEARFAWWIAHVFCLFIAFVDYFVYEFRENEVSFADISSVGTGLSVMKSYRLQLHDRGAIALLLSALLMAVIRRSRIETKRLVRWIIRAAAAVALIAMVMYLRGRTARMVTQTWEKKGTYKNGFVLNFVLGVGDGIVKAPEGYDLSEIEALEAEYGNAADAADAADQTGAVASNTVTGVSSDTSLLMKTKAPTVLNGRKPVIITIMDESFADFRNVGNLTTNIEVLPFLDTLTENTMRGFALASVYGAKTPNSEWEYLTGNSMAFLPEGSVVYEQYITKTPTSLVSTLKNEGYTAVAMHPYQNTGWKRNTVYPKLGFDEMYFLEDGYFDETKILRKYITDQELFDKIIERYEQQQTQDPDTPLFIMSITMQNHGGYKEKYDNFTNDVIYQTPSGFYEDANQYLSLTHETDKALENLIGYFEAQDVPVEIIFFGDHLPSLQSAFFRSLNGKGISGLTLTQLQQLFSVPFFIWTNYDTEETSVELTSINYLSTLALSRAGIELPPYNRFLADLMTHIPAMNARAFYSVSSGKFLHYDKAAGEEKEWIDRYDELQYNEMFDKSGKSSVFFPYLKE